MSTQHVLRKNLFYKIVCIIPLFYYGLYIFDNQERSTNICNSLSILFLLFKQYNLAFLLSRKKSDDSLAVLPIV